MAQVKLPIRCPDCGAAIPSAVDGYPAMRFHHESCPRRSLTKDSVLAQTRAHLAEMERIERENTPPPAWKHQEDE